MIWLVIVLASACAASGGGSSPSAATIAAPPAGGIYLGKLDVPAGAQAQFEEAVGRQVALGGALAEVHGQEEAGEGGLWFDIDAARRTYAEGRVIAVGAYEATPAHPGFTVDRLLMGEYDDDLEALAEGFREFGRPMFFGAAREPNGVLASHMGGFGPDGSMGLEVNEVYGPKGFENQFDPSKFPNSELYAGLGDPDVCDGAERLVAAHRYYYDFFVRREGLEFLTFETMGWAVFAPPPPGVDSEPPNSCSDFRNLYPGNEYVDWVSLTWYVSEGGYGGVTVQDQVQAFDDMMAVLAEIAPDKPVLISELGFADAQAGPDSDSDAHAAVVRTVLDTLLRHPQIGGFWQWGGYAESEVQYAVDVVPGTKVAEVFASVVAANPDRFHSCVYSAGGLPAADCE